jgi:hypothetical protein
VSLDPEGVVRQTAQADVRPVVLWPLAAFFSRFPLPLVGLPSGPSTVRAPCSGESGRPGRAPRYSSRLLSSHLAAPANGHDQGTRTATSSRFCTPVAAQPELTDLYPRLTPRTRVAP